MPLSGACTCAPSGRVDKNLAGTVSCQTSPQLSPIPRMTSNFLDWWCGGADNAWIWDPSRKALSPCIEVSMISASPLQWILILHGLYIGWSNNRTLAAERKTWSKAAGSMPSPDTILGLTCLLRAIYVISFFFLLERSRYPPYIVYCLCLLFTQNLHSAVLLLCHRGIHVWLGLRTYFMIGKVSLRFPETRFNVDT